MIVIVVIEFVLIIRVQHFVGVAVVVVMVATVVVVVVVNRRHIAGPEQLIFAGRPFGSSGFRFFSDGLELAGRLALRLLQLGGGRRFAHDSVQVVTAAGHLVFVTVAAAGRRRMEERRDWLVGHSGRCQFAANVA